MKTVKEWFELIKDEKIRKEALENMSPYRSEKTYKSVNSAILNGITNWEDTPQKGAYWDRIYKSEIELLNEPKDNQQEIINRIETLQKDNRDITNHVIKRIAEVEEIVKNQSLAGGEPKQERKLIMSVEELGMEKIDEFDDWKDENGIVTDTFKALKFIEHQWNEGKAFDWENGEDKHCLFLYENEWMKEGFYVSHQIFNFHTKEHAELFLQTFAKELEIIKPLFS